MSNGHVTFTVFTKPWKTLPLPQLAAFVKSVGFDGIELPVRPGFQVEPESVAHGLRQAVHVFAESGLAVTSVAGPTDEATIAACAENGVSIIRICVDIPPERNYLEYETHLQRQLDTLLPVLDRYRVTLGIQNHYGRYVANAMSIRHLIERFDPRHIGAVLDPAHCGLNGEIPAFALDIVWSHLCMVNLKNAYWRRTTGPEAEVAAFEAYWTSGRQGLCSWASVVAELQRRDYRGPICLPAEYTDEPAVDRLIAQDLAYARSLFET
jgi:sugar phosphate isomerase/epimerase